MKLLGWSAALMAVVLLPIAGADAAIQILAGPGGPNPSENVLFNNNPPDGLTVQGITNATSALVNFTGLETLHGDGGAASLSAIDGAYSQVSWVLNTPGGYEDLKFNVVFPKDQDDGSITITILDQFNVATIFGGTLSSGNNQFQAHGSSGSLITQVTLTGTAWEELKQIRIGEDPPIAAAPELSTWAMMLIGFAGLGFVAYRRTRKLSALHS